MRTNNNVFPIATALTVDAGATFDLDVKSQEVGSLSGAGVVHINGATGSAQTFTVGNLGTSTTFSGSFTEGTITGGRVTKVGGGTLTLSGTSSYTGATTISGGILATNLLANGGTASGIGQSTSAAGNLVLDGGRLRYTGPAVSTDRLFTLNSTGGIIDARGTGPLMFTSTGTVGGPGTGTLTLTGTNTGANTLSPVLNGSNTAVIKSGAGTWVLTGANSYGGATTITNGVLSTNLMSTGGNPSGIGASSDAPNNLVLDGGTLQYTGPLVSTSRQFTLTQNGGGLDASGTGAIIYTSSSIIVLSGSGSRTLTLSGTNTGLNSLNGVISNGAGGATSLVKSGPGTWVLGGGGVNAYTGTTTVNGGTLVVSSGAWITSGATLSVNSTGTLAGTAGANQIASPVAINGGGAIRGGVTGGTGTLNVGNTVTVANNGTIRTEVSRTGANTATDSKIIINAGSLNLAPNAGDKFFIDIVNNGASPMIAGETYTITLATVASGVINVHGVAASGVISPSNYTLFSGMTTATGVSLTASGGNLNLTFTPVPEPTTVLGLTAGVLGLGRVVHRRLRGSQTV